MKVTEQNESEAKDNVEDPDYEASSDENNTLSINRPVMAQPPAYKLPSKNVHLLWSPPHLNDRVDLVLLISSKWFQGPPDTLSTKQLHQL